MKYWGICIFAIAVIIIAVVLYLKLKKRKDIPSNVIGIIDSPAIKGKDLFTVPNTTNQSIIPLEMLPAEAIEDENKLIEITDSKILVRVNNLIPGLAQAGNAVNNAAQAIKVANSEVLYRAVIPTGAKLTNSKAMEGAVRGIYHGADGIKGHANLVAVETQKGPAVIINSAAAAMGVASMVVGQYYMTQINAELSVISNGISQIQDFQDNEYRSRVFSLVSHVKKIADFQTEILENGELRLSKILQLDSLEEECTQLLGQANLTLAGFSKKTELDYKEYEKALSSAQNWFMYQKSLLDVLYKISDLRYALHLGTVSREQCVALLPEYTKQVGNIQECLTAWHNILTQRLGIETEEIRRKRAGIDGMIHFIPGLFNDDLNFRSIEKNTVRMITEQVSGHKALHEVDTSELYNEDVQLISKDGRIYYLPESKGL